MNENKLSGFTSPILVLLLVIASFLMGVIWTQSRQKGEVEEQLPQETGETVLQPEEERVLGESSAGIGNFKVLTEEEVCREDDLPVVYYFGSSSCPHCTWEYPVVKSVMDQFEGEIAFKDGMDNIEEYQETWDQYVSLNQNSYPFMILGCRYWQLGSGESFGEEKEAENIAALLCKLTNGEPAGVCAPLQEVIDSI